MGLKKDVKTYLLDHSEVKVRLLGKYVNSYLSIISNDGYTSKIKMYDLFCGEGIYQDGGQGSPLVMLKAINTIWNNSPNKMPKIECLFNDINTHKVDKLKNYIESNNLKGKCEVNYDSIDYEILIKKVQTEISQSKNEKAFIFIDPYGYKNIKASDIKELIKNGKAEVLLFLPTQFMYRFDASGTPESLKDFIDEITSIKDWKVNETVWHFIDQLKEAFKSYLGSKYFVDTFTIQKDPGTVYCLFFFCSHIKGFEKMLDAKWDIDTEEGKGWEYHGMSETLFNVLKINPLEEKLKSYLQEKQRTNSEVYEYTLHNGFLPTHANEVLRSLQKSGSISVIDKTGKKVRNNSFYLNYSCYRDDPDKVTIKLN